MVWCRRPKPIYGCSVRRRRRGGGEEREGVKGQ